LTSVATGAWTLTVSSGALVSDTSLTMTGVTVSTEVALTATTDKGYVSGVVTTVGGTPLQSIAVAPAGSLTDSNGFFRLSLNEGIQTVTANLNSASNASYIEASTNVTVTVGQVVSGITLTLSGGGKVRGKVTLDGTNALPDVPVSIINANTGVEEGNVLSQSDGYFELSASTGSYYAEPIPQFGEVVSPSSSPTVNVTGGSTVFTSTFTVGPALGTITGSVYKSGEEISTGVLVVATTATIVGAPPDIDATLRSGSVLYFMASSSADGTYSVDVKAGTYNVYGWYTTFDAAGTATITPDSVTGVLVTAGATASGKDLSF
jgi:hypothetical protein